jgi:hypothetical protein
MTNIRQETARLLKKDYGIEESITDELFNRRILFEPAIRNALIREEYMRKAKPKEKNILKSKLADKYCISFFSIEKIISIIN